MTDGPYQQKRIALIIGNAKYQHAPPLRNAVNDAKGIADALERIHFDRVELHENLGYAEMKQVVRKFGATTGSSDIAMLYFAGHGIEVGGVNYLIPIDARLPNERDVPHDTIEPNVRPVGSS